MQGDPEDLLDQTVMKWWCSLDSMKRAEVLRRIEESRGYPAVTAGEAYRAIQKLEGIDPGPKPGANGC
jgi:hypothetical protein